MIKTHFLIKTKQKRQEGVSKDKLASFTLNSSQWLVM